MDLTETQNDLKSAEARTRPTDSLAATAFSNHLKKADMRVRKQFVADLDVDPSHAFGDAIQRHVICKFLSDNFG